MSLDITYRPRIYEDVLGQEATVKILRRFVSEGRGFRQSYLFCGLHGSGKTTLGRILARALLCEAPVEGDPCDQCASCRSMLEFGTSADFIEVDAATHSGKADVTRITEEIQYNTFSGKRRIYLFDEAHQLSRDALDALLKPLEDTMPGSEDKQLVCIFCTTEPERMRATVLSRCAPAFVIRAQSPQVIGERLAHICAVEGIEADPEMLVLIAEAAECHIRDALKAVEGVAMLGAVNRENVTAYLNLDLNTTYIDLIDRIGVDLAGALAKAQEALQRVSPGVLYRKLLDVCMLGVQAALGETPPTFWNGDILAALGQRKKNDLLVYAARFAERPGRPTASMLIMDIACLHHGGTLTPTPQVTMSTKPSVEVQIPGNISDQDKSWVLAERGKAGKKGQDQTAQTPTAFRDMLHSKLAELSSGPKR